MSTHLSRRKFLQCFFAIGSAGSILIGCTDETADLNTSGENLRSDQVFSCSDISELTGAEASLRNTFEYTDQSPKEAQNCANCTLYIATESGCGGCATIKGPIHPQGYCTLWAAQTT